MLEPEQTVASEKAATPCRVIRVRFCRTRRLTQRTDPPRRAMARLWNDLVRLHKRIRRSRWKWPALDKYDAHFIKRKARYRSLPSAGIQQAVRKFFGNLKTTRENQKNGLNARYPWRDQKHFATVPYRGNLVHWTNGRLTLGGGNGSPPIVIPMAENPGEILKAELLFDEVLVTVAVPGETRPASPASPTPNEAAGDPGQRWAWTIVTAQGQSLMLHGRGLVSEKIRHAKKQAHLQAALAGKKAGSRRHKKIKRRIARWKAKSARRVRDMHHKTSRAVVNFGEQVGVTQLVLSQPDGIAQAPGRKAQRQRNGAWTYGEQSRQIEYKAQGKFEVVRDQERGTSSTCPRCGQRAKPAGRVFRCPACGWTGHRDLLGAGTQLGRHAPHVDVAALIEQTRPKYLRAFKTPKARSSAVETGRSYAMAVRASDPDEGSRYESGSSERATEGQHRPVRAGAGRPLRNRPPGEEKFLALHLF